MSVLFIGKRFYTNRDALNERYGRIYQLPWHWAKSGIHTRLWLVDYHTLQSVSRKDDPLQIISTSVRNFAALWHYYRESRANVPNQPKPKLIVASGDCYIGMMGYRLARRLNLPFVFDVYDKYDEFGGYLRVPGFDPFRFLLKKADARLFASRFLMENVGCTGENDLLVPNGIDASRFKPMSLRDSRAALGLPQNVTFVGYFGGMESDRGIDDLIAAIQQLRTEKINIELLLGGKPRRNLDVFQPGIRFLGDVPYESMPKALCSCDLLSIPYRRSPFMDAGASNKIAEAIACGRPIVVTRTPNFVSNFPRQAEQLADLVASPSNPNDLAHVVRLQCIQRKTVDMPTGFDWYSIAKTLMARLDNLTI